MPRCEKCHSQWANIFRCPHCERKFPCPNFVFIWSFSVLAAVVLLIAIVSSFQHKVEDWQAVEKEQPVKEKGLTVEIDKSTVE
jgi:hypothetical protein